MEKIFVHDQGLCESEQVGEGTRIWAFAHVLPGARIGKECNICDHVFIENDVIIGDGVTIKCGVQIWDGVRLGNYVFVGPNATFTNDNFPRSKEYPKRFLETVVEEGASIGANATILAGLRIGYKAMVGAGAVVTHDVPPNAIVTGNPARITGYVHLTQNKKIRTYIDHTLNGEPSSEPFKLGVGDCQLWPLPRFQDMRGDLVPVEFDKNLPFTPRRQFFVYAIPGDKVRGEHAHKRCEQFLIAVNGAVNIVVDDGNSACEVCLDSPAVGLYLPAQIWGIQYKFTHDAILSVYASEPYDADDYIRSYDEYLKFIRK
jgi:UDP-2-acetamido-3-amino-2,3-dideoxy-glucuronate N-acetyltransferase